MYYGSKSLLLFMSSIVIVQCSKTIKYYDEDILINSSISWQKHAIEVYSKFCDSRSFCNKSIVYNGNYRKPMKCLPCSCDDYCHHYDNCCLDKKLLFAKHVVKASCLPFNPQRCFHRRNDKFVHVFNRCPKYYRNKTTIDKCQNEASIFSDFKTYVTSIHSGVTYKNSDCAFCHGLKERDVMPWSLSFKCIYNLFGEKSKTEKCCFQDVSQPYSISTSKLHLCQKHHEVINYANFLDWDMETSIFLTKMCSKFKFLVKIDGKLFRNIYCAIRPSVPDKFVTTTPFILFTFGSAAPPIIPSFNILIKSDDYVKVVYKKEPAKCRENEVFDIYKVKCQPVQCDFDKNYRKDSCRRNITGSKELKYRMNYELLPMINTSFSALPDDVVDLHKEDFTQTIQRVNITRFITWTVKVYGHLQGHASTSSIRKIQVSQSFVIQQTEKTVERNENLLIWYSKHNLLFVIIKNYSFDILKHRSYEDRSMSDEIVLTSGIDCPFVEYKMKNVKRSNGGDKIFKIFETNVTIKDSDFQISKKSLKVCTRHFLLSGKYSASPGLYDGSSGSGNYSGVYFTGVVEGWVTLICCIVSLIGLGLTFLTYSLFKELRTGPGINTMTLVAHIFVFQLLFLCGIVKRQGQREELCSFIGWLIHYSFLSSLSWMTICAFHMHSVFTNFRPPRWTLKRFLLYSASANGISLIITIICIAIHASKMPFDYIGYGGDICYISTDLTMQLGFIIVPISVMFLVNIILFVRTVYHIRRTVVASAATVTQENKAHVSVYFKLMVLIGFTWIIGMLRYAVSSPVLSYLFIIFNALQGLMIFVAYCCNPRILHKYRKCCWKTEYDESSDKSNKKTNVAENQTMSTDISRKNRIDH